MCSLSRRLQSVHALLFRSHLRVTKHDSPPEQQDHNSARQSKHKDKVYAPWRQGDAESDTAQGKHKYCKTLRSRQQLIKEVPNAELDTEALPERLDLYNIKIDLRKVRYDGRDWINISQDRDRWRAYARAAMNLRIL
ncbi:hypothetical protein ANN_10609 [Periplaneta americana]|uniref:Uncharacterized protein n=1 Tax=Periplaneta americana TaxID=6978 RepID=A0ABQ8TTC5_PERAM|nr:hypothetical protein ANN_10609 [Periplaneta americana]